MATIRRIAGVDLRVVNNELLGRMIGRFGMRVKGGDALIIPFNVEARIRTVTELIEQLYGKEEIVDCALCGGFGPWNMAHCPFCGSGDPELETKEARRAQMEQNKQLAKAANGKGKQGMVKVNEKDLDQNVASIRSAKVKTAVCCWEMGSLISKNKTLGLWKLRSDTKNAPKYTTFAQFCRDELQMSRSHADSMASIADAFSRDQVKRFGAKKLSLVLQLPDELRSQLLDGASTSEGEQMLDAAVEDAKEKKQRDKPPKAPSGKISISQVLGEVEIPFTVPGKGKRSKPRPAKVTDDLEQAFASEQFVNGVVAVYRLQQNTRGELVLRVERARSDG